MSSLVIPLVVTDAGNRSRSSDLKRRKPTSRDGDIASRFFRFIECKHRVFTTEQGYG